MVPVVPATPNRTSPRRAAIPAPVVDDAPVPVAEKKKNNKQHAATERKPSKKREAGLDSQKFSFCFVLFCFFFFFFFFFCFFF